MEDNLIKVLKTGLHRSHCHQTLILIIDENNINETKTSIHYLQFDDLLKK